jgi:aspartate/methionine/tyrosine aminotransferase
MRERTITINAMSKTYSVTGWRVGYAIAPPEVTNAIRKMHDFLTVGAAAPLQQAGATALRLPETYYQQLCEGYQARRDRMLAGLEQAGFRCFRPHGAYYIMADISAFGFPNDVEFARYMVQEIGVGVVPGQQLLPRSCFRSTAGAVYLLQKGRHAGRSPAAIGEAAGVKSRCQGSEGKVENRKNSKFPKLGSLLGKEGIAG